MPTTEIAPASAAAGRRWPVLTLLTIGMVIAYIDRSNLSVAVTLPEFKLFFGLSDRDRGALLAAFFWSYALLQIPAGWIVDRYGVRIPYAAGFFVWSATSALTAFASTHAQLFALRVLLGAGEAVAPTASMRWIRFHYDDRRRGLATGVWMLGTKFGPAIGPPIAAWLIAAYGWRRMFFILGAGLLLWLIPWLLLTREEDPGREAKPAGETPPEPSFSRVLASPTVLGLVGGTFGYMYFVYFCMTWLPAYLVEQRNLSLQSMSFYSFFSFAGMAAVTVLGGWAADRRAARGGNGIRVRKAFIAGGMLIASTELFGALTDSRAAALFFAVVPLSGLGLAGANKWALAQSVIPPASIGRVLGMQNCAANLAGIAAPLLTGWLKQATGSFSAPLLAVGVFLLAGAAAFWFLVNPVTAGGAPRPVRG